ncbi:MAG: hypothetical protein K2Y35_13390 [Burkholderiales bacterium]|nr:hypothetical protein [Burkholderiales bacterium]
MVSEQEARKTIDRLMTQVDGDTVNYGVHPVRTRVAEPGGKVQTGYHPRLLGKLSRTVRLKQVYDEFAYDPNQFDRDVGVVDLIRTLVRPVRDELPTEIFRGRAAEVPKTLIFDEDESQDEDLVKIASEKFGKGSQFAQQITYRTAGESPERMIAAFHNGYNPRVSIIVDMITAGTDIKSLEIVMFGAVKHRDFHEQMTGRGVPPSAIVPRYSC